MALPFFIFGYYFRTYIKNSTWKNYFALTIPLFAIISYLLTIINGRVSMHGVKFGILPAGINIICFYINALIGSLMMLQLSLIPIKPSQLISKAGRALIGVVGCQEILINTLGRFYVINYNVSISIISTFLIMTISILYYYFQLKFLPFTLGR